MRLLAIDPGPAESALLVYSTVVPGVIEWRKAPNPEVLDLIGVYRDAADRLAVEMIASYGMPVGAEVFETCVWIGRFIERWHRTPDSPDVHLVYRRDVKSHLCHSAKAKDPNVRQALIDRFGPGKAKAVGLKATPGPLYGLAGDGWAALGVAITASETMMELAA